MKHLLLMKNIIVSFICWLLKPLQSSLDEYKLIGKIWTGQYPEHSNQLPLSPLERSVMSFLIVIRSLSLTHLCNLATHYKIASFISEFYVILRFVLLSLMLIICSRLPIWFCYIITIYFLIDGLNYRLCIIFVDRYAKNWGLRSLNRSLILLLINYCEIIIGFAILYLISGSVGFNFHQQITLRSEAIYFSVVTITTLGYGDIRPITSLGRWLSVSETLMGFILIVLIIGTFLTGIKNIRNIHKNKVQGLDSGFNV